MSEKLLPCPYCGCKDVVAIPRSIMEGGWQVCCMAGPEHDGREKLCDVRGPVSISAEGAEKRWNAVAALKVGMKLPGMTAIHAIITDDCRTGRGDEGAVDEALKRAREELKLCLGGWEHGRGAKFHVAVTVERPE